VGAVTGGAVGSSVLRAEDPRLLTGRGRFVGDIDLPRMVHAAFVRSYLAHAQVEEIVVDEAIALDGVVNVLVSRDLPDVWMSSGRHPSLGLTPQRPLAKDRVRFVGEAVALVLASDRYVAEDGVDLVNVHYAPVAGSTPLHEQLEDNVVFRDADSIGDVEAAFAMAQHVTRQSLSMARQNAAPMEPRGCVADFDPASRRLTVYSCTQGPHRLRRDLAAVTGLGENQIRVVITDIGGGFGQKIPTQLEDVAVVLAAMALGRPVKWIEDRRENLIAAPQSRGQSLDLELALDGELTITGARARFSGDSGAYSANSASPLTESYRSSRAVPGVYTLGSYAYDTTIELTNRPPIAPYRGVGFVGAQVLRELTIDKAARELGVNPRLIRRRNMISREMLPFTTLTGWRYDNVSFVETFDLAATALDEALEALGEPGIGTLRGTALTPFVEPNGIGTRGGLEVHGFASPSHDSARVTLDPLGTFTVSFGTPSMGQGLETTMAQMAADAVGARVEDVTVTWGDTSQAPVSFTGARASRSAVVSGGAVRLASLELHDQLIEVAAEMLEVDPFELHIRDSQVWVAGEPVARLSLRDVAGVAFAADRSQTKGAHAFDVTRTFDPPVNYSNAAVGAVIDVDVATGSVTVRTLIAVEDCGRVINPMIVDGQFSGGAAQGIGAVLLERIHYNEEEQPLTSTLMDYLLPTAHDVIATQVRHYESPTLWNEDAAGVKGMGESGAIGTAGAIACALADALAQRGGAFTQMPMLPFRIWEEIARPDALTTEKDKP
jgi:CO/xanthine dehydrogenase Mo-binding subunit